MTERRIRRLRVTSRKLLAGFFLLILVAVFSGCQNLAYYKQAIQGECQILSHRQSIEKLIADPQTASELREKLKLVLQLRQFAEEDLRLPTDDQYLRYVDLHRSFVVWNVHAAYEFSLEPKTWWYPFVGSLKYRGYFSEQGARRYAHKLQEKGWETCVEGVTAYSTLGWFKDPLLNTFINESAPDLAETLFHELAHQRLFISGDTDFNEAFATIVGEEGVRRWLRANGEQSQYEKYAAALGRNEQFVRLVMDTREQLKSLYSDRSALTVPGASPTQRSEALRPSEVAPAAWLRRDQILAQLRENYAKLKLQWGGLSNYDSWFARPLNNAQLNTVATYYDLVPGFRVLLQNCGGDLEQFFAQVRVLRKLKKAERHRKIQSLKTEPLKG